MLPDVTNFKGEQIYERDETKCKEETGSEEDGYFTAGFFYVLHAVCRMWKEGENR